MANQPLGFMPTSVMKHSFKQTRTVSGYYVCVHARACVNVCICVHLSELEIAVSHWPFSDQFAPFGQANPIRWAKFTVHFQWGTNDSVPAFKEWQTNFKLLFQALFIGMNYPLCMCRSNGKAVTRQ